LGGHRRDCLRKSEGRKKEGKESVGIKVGGKILEPSSRRKNKYMEERDTKEQKKKFKKYKERGQNLVVSTRRHLKRRKIAT